MGGFVGRFICVLTPLVANQDFQQKVAVPTWKLTVTAETVVSPSVVSQ